MPHNLRMHLTCYSGLRPLPPAGDADVRPLESYAASNVGKWVPPVRKPFTITAAALLLLIALLQLLRFIMGWEVTLNGVSIPVWVSGIAAVVAAGLAVMVWMETRK
jgi:hypothetical protein